MSKGKINPVFGSGVAPRLAQPHMRNPLTAGRMLLSKRDFVESFAPGKAQALLRHLSFPQFSLVEEKKCKIHKEGISEQLTLTQCKKHRIQQYTRSTSSMHRGLGNKAMAFTWQFTARFRCHPPELAQVF